jgi:hypothetical protein
MNGSKSYAGGYLIGLTFTWHEFNRLLFIC